MIVTRGNNTMETIELIIENASKAEAKLIKSAYEHHLDYANNVTINTILDTMMNLAIWHPFKVGRGGNHVWVSNLKNERLAIITFTQIKTEGCDCNAQAQ